MSTKVQLVKGIGVSQLLERDENNELKIPISGGTVYFLKDGRIVWDSDINSTPSRIVMGRDEVLTTTMENITLNATTWTDIMSLDTTIFPNASKTQMGGGTYALQIYIDSATDNIAEVKQTHTFYSGITSWFWGPHFDGVSTADEILLHRSGQKPYDIYIYAKIEKRGDNSVLSLKSNTDLTIDNLSIKLCKLI